MDENGEELAAFLRKLEADVDRRLSSQEKHAKQAYEWSRKERYRNPVDFSERILSQMFFIEILNERRANYGVSEADALGMAMTLVSVTTNFVLSVLRERIGTDKANMITGEALAQATESFEKTMDAQGRKNNGEL